MTKKYKVIKIEDYYVVVDDSITKGFKNQWVVETHLPYNTICQLSGDWDLTRCGYKDKLVITTIGKRIGELPLIEIPDEVQQLSTIWNNTKEEKHNRNWNAEQFLNYRLKRYLKEDANTEYILQATKLMIAAEKGFAFRDGYKAATKKYSEEDMTQAVLIGARNPKNPKQAARDLHAYKQSVVNKPITSVELELELAKHPSIIGVTLPNYILKVSETNTITPVNIFYE